VDPVDENPSPLSRPRRPPAEQRITTAFLVSMKAGSRQGFSQLKISRGVYLEYFEGFEMTDHDLSIVYSEQSEEYF
jgi:hypothetical protein